VSLSSPAACRSVNLEDNGFPVSVGGASNEAGPWFLDARIQGPAAGACSSCSCKEDGEFWPYDAEFAMRLVVVPGYPKEPPRVRFRTIMHHPFVSNDTKDDHHERRVGPLFYKALRAEKDAHPETSTLRAVVTILRRMLQEPLDANPSKWSSSLTENRHRVDIVRRYARQVKHPKLFDKKIGWQEEWFAPSIRPLLGNGNVDLVSSALEEVTPGVYSFDMLTAEFCGTFLEEIDNFYASGIPAARPNSMNNYGVILNDIGFEPMIEQLQKCMLQPIAATLFPREGAEFDSHHTFIVKYRGDEDPHLDVHVDDSDVTFNVCLGRHFKGCGLVFCGMVGSPEHRQWCHTYNHKIGKCVVHLGRKRHGADNITEGERLNLIIWNHSIAWRSSRESQNVFSQESGPPDQRCLSYTHDRDFGHFREYPEGKEHFRGRGWCPPKHAEYDGFAAAGTAA